MRYLVLGALLATAACADSEEARFLECTKAFEEGRAFDVADTDAWRLGRLPFWSTLDRVKEVYGAPSDSSSLLGSLWSYRFGTEDVIVFEVIGDSLAYPGQVHLERDTLYTSRGALHSGLTEKDLRPLFPQSQECPDFPIGAAWSSDLYDAQWSIWDSTRRAIVNLYFRDERLVGVGVGSYERAMEAGRER